MTQYALDIHCNKHSVTVDEINWRPSVYAVIIKDGKILLSPQLGGYVLPGGGVELTEKLEEALIREIREETGYDIEPGEQFGFCENLFVWEPTDPTQRYVARSLCFFYSAAVTGGEITTDYLDKDEAAFAGPAEWVALDMARGIKWIGSINYLAMVEQYLAVNEEK